jgi:hypothetical protein
VPEELTCSPMFAPPGHGGPLYRLSFYNLISAHMAGFPAGAGRRAFDEFVVAAEGKHWGLSPTSVADKTAASAMPVSAPTGRRSTPSLRSYAARAAPRFTARK